MISTTRGELVTTLHDLLVVLTVAASLAWAAAVVPGARLVSLTVPGKDNRCSTGFEETVGLTSNGHPG